jgi:hypothetical protein
MPFYYSCFFKDIENSRLMVIGEGLKRHAKERVLLPGT